MTAAHYLFLKPRKRRRYYQKLAELRQEHQEYLLAQRLEAESAVALLQESVSRKVAAERSRKGLVVTRATWGPEHPKKNAQDVQALDVTIALQALVDNGQLILPGGRTKSGLLGFVRCF